MTIEERLMEDLKEAMKAGEAGELRKSTIRMARAALKNEQIAVGHPLSDEEAITVLQKQVKQRRDSIEEFQKAGRTDLADKEAGEIAVLQVYLPQQMGEEEIATVAREVIAQAGASGPADLGKVMPTVMSRLKGKAEGRLINTVVRRLLEGQA